MIDRQVIDLMTMIDRTGIWRYFLGAVPATRPTVEGFSGSGYGPSRGEELPVYQVRLSYPPSVEGYPQETIASNIQEPWFA